jgi:hypothetical protein
MATKQHPRFINVAGQIYQLETAAGDVAGREAPADEPVKQIARESEQYFSGKGAEKIDAGKESKATEKTLSLPAATDKENAANIPDKFTSPDKSFYDGKESKRDLNSFRLKGLSDKQYEENDPTKMPAKIMVKGELYELVQPTAPPARIKVKGEVYELVQDEPLAAPPAAPPAAQQDDLPAQIRVKGEVYERVIPPDFIKVGGKTFVKLGQAEAMEVLAKKGGEKKWKKYLRGLSDEAKHSTRVCNQELKDKIEDAAERKECCTWIKEDQAEKDKAEKAKEKAKADKAKK